MRQGRRRWYVHRPLRCKVCSSSMTDAPVDSCELSLALSDCGRSRIRNRALIAYWRLVKLGRVLLLLATEFFPQSSVALMSAQGEGDGKAVASAQARRAQGQVRREDLADPPAGKLTLASTDVCVCVDDARMNPTSSEDVSPRPSSLSAAPASTMPMLPAPGRKDTWG